MVTCIVQHLRFGKGIVVTLAVVGIVCASEHNASTDIPLDLEGFGEGWKAHVSYPRVPSVTAESKCELWVEHGWLHARRRDSTEIVWQIVLAKVQEGVMPTIRRVAESPSLHVTYADGRYFIRDNSLVLRTLRQKANEQRPTFRATDVLSEDTDVGRFSGFSAGFGRFITGKIYNTWFCAMSGPTRTEMDCFVRLNRRELYDVANTTFGGFSQGFSQMSDGLLNAYYGAKSLSDDGEMLVAHYNVPLLAQKQVNQKKIRENLVDARAPEIVACEWLNTAPLNWEQLRGKVVVLDFWATWCLPCVKKLPEMQDLADKFADDELVVIGVHSAKDGHTCADFVREMELTFPIAVDTGETEQHFGLDGFPAYFLIDKSGKVVDGYLSSSPDEATIRNYLEAQGVKK